MGESAAEPSEKNVGGKASARVSNDQAAKGRQVITFTGGHNARRDKRKRCH